MTICCSTIRKTPATPHETVGSRCCSILRLYVPPPPYVYQPETTAYLENADVAILNDGTVYFGSTAYEITGAEIWTALDTCVIAIKQAYGLTLGLNNLSTQFKYIYPRVGGTATAHRINLVNPATFVGTFYGGWTHDGSGALPNGTNGYMDTACLYNDTEFTQGSQTFGFISKTNANSLLCDFGTTAGGFAGVLMYGRNGGNLLTRLCDGTNSSVAVADSIAHFSMSRTNTSEYKKFRNGTLIDTPAIAASGLSSLSNSVLNIYEAAANNGATDIQHSPRKRTWHYAGLGSTDAEIQDLHNALTNFETALNR